MDQKTIKPIILLSLPRSGSTLLQKLLMSHTKISSTAECWFLLPHVFANKSRGIVASYSQITAYHAIKDMIRILPNKQLDYYRFLGEFATNIYSSLSNTGSEYYLDKTPRYYLIINELVQMFPEAKFIFLFRNPIQVFASFVSTYGSDRFRMFSSRVNYHGINEGPKLISMGYESLKENSIALKYEDLIADPNNHLKQILQFLDLEYEENMLQNFYKQDLKGQYFDPNGEIYKNKIVDVTLTKWKKVFNSRYRKSIVRNYIKNIDEKTLLIQGYNKDEMLEEINILKTGGAHNLIKDIIDYNFSRLINKSARLSYD